MSFDGTPVPTGNAEAAIGVATVRPFSADDDETVQAVEGSATALEAALDSSDLDVCFLVDTSGGMERYLDGVIRVIQNIARELHGHQGIRYPRFALVAYNDFPFDATVHSHLPDVFDFTTNLDVFGSNVEKGLTAKVASDYAEDVHSGLHAVLGLNFGDNSTKLLLHIADAPCHGAHFHHPGMLDDYAQADPEATLALVRDIARRKIDFVFCAIEDEPGVPVAKRKNRTKFSTQTMFDRFDKAYSAAHPQRRSMTLTDLSDPANIVAEVRQAIVTSLSSTSVLSAFQQQHCAVRQRRFVRTVRPANFAAYPLIKCDQHSIKLRADKLQPRAMRSEAQHLRRRVRGCGGVGGCGGVREAASVPTVEGRGGRSMIDVCAQCVCGWSGAVLKVTHCAAVASSPAQKLTSNQPTSILMGSAAETGPPRSTSRLHPNSSACVVVCMSTAKSSCGGPTCRD